MADDPLDSYLRGQRLSQSQRRAAWDAFTSSKDADELTPKLKALELPVEIKRQLWNMKESAVPVSTEPEQPETKQPQSEPTKSPSEKAAETAQKWGQDFVSGVKGGVARLVYGGGDLIRRGVGMDRIINQPDVQAAMAIPETAGGRVGHDVEQAVQFMLPMSRVASLTGAAALPIRMAAQGATAGGTAYVQGDNPTVPALLGAATPIPGAVASAVRENQVPIGRGLTQLGGWLSGAPNIGTGRGTSMLRLAGDPLQKIGNRMTDAADYETAKRLLGLTGDVPVQAPAAPVATERDLFRVWQEPSVPPRTGPPPRVVPGGAPTVEAGIQQELQNLMGSRAVPARSTAPVPSGATITLGGRPSVTAAEQAAIEAGAAARPATAAPAAAPIAPVPSHAPTTGPAAAWTPERLTSALEKATSRANVKLTKEQLDMAGQLVREGHPPLSAVQRVATMSDVQNLASEIGSRNAARRLGTTQEHIDQLRGHAMAVLPQGARTAIDAKLATLKTPEAIKAYMDAAPNEVARAYIKFKAGL